MKKSLIALLLFTFTATIPSEGSWFSRTNFLSKKSFAIAAVAAVAGSYIWSKSKSKQEHTSLQQTTLTTIQYDLPQLQYIGVGTSAHQIEGNMPHSGWAHYNKDGKNLDHKDCCLGWNKKFQDIKLLKELGVNTYRSSISWSRVQPKENTPNINILREYKHYYQALINADITPVITLHHYEDPAWFLEKGGFTKAENIEYFINFTKLVKQHILNELQYTPTVKQVYIVTFNQPSGYASKCYRSGDMPPYDKGNTMSTVTQNILDMHVQAYTVLKGGERGNKIQVSISHQYTPCLAHSWYNPLDKLIAFIANKKTNGNFESFFKKHTDTLDFVALSYYSPLRFKGIRHNAYYESELQHPCNPDDFRICYPQGMKQALQWANQFGKPIFVVENGIATTDEQKRELYVKMHLHEINKFMNASKNNAVLGYCYWSFMDNFENEHGVGKYRFGLYHVDFESSDKARILKSKRNWFKTDISSCIKK